MSSIYKLHNGIPQGSVMSGTLFIVAINAITKHLPKKILNSLYVDDFAVYYAARHVRHIQRVLNTAIKAVYQWAKSVGLKFALSKTQGIVFYRNSKWLCKQDIKLKIDKHRIEMKPAVKFLGVYLDSHLNWRHHVSYIKGKAMSALNLIKKMSNIKWGSKRKTLVMLFKATVLAIINYCAPIYASATQTVLKALQPRDYLMLKSNLK